MDVVSPKNQALTSTDNATRGLTMDALVIRGGRKLQGRVEISGAKNAALPVMAATLLAPGVHTLRNVPLLSDTRTMANVLRVLGAEIEFKGNTCTIDTSNADKVEAPYDLVRTMRASIYVLGPLLARFGGARVSLPGGCAWGPRPVNLHLEGLEALGAQLEIEHGYIVGQGREAQGRAFRVPGGLGRRDRAAHDGGDARPGHDDARQRRDRARHHGARRGAESVRRAHRGPRYPHDHDPRRARAAPDRHHDHPRPHRGGDVPRRGGDHGRLDHARPVRSRAPARDHAEARGGRLRGARGQSRADDPRAGAPRRRCT